MEDQLHDIRKRSYQYWYQDGLSELTMGGFFLALVAFYGLQTYLETSKFLTAVLSLGLIVLIIGGVYLVRLLTRNLKTRLTYPRTGYVAFQQSKQNRRRRVILFALFFGGTMGVLTSVLRGNIYWTPAALGVIFAAAWAYYGYRSGIIRFYILALLMGAAGLGVSLTTTTQSWALLVFYAICCAGMLLSGAITLVRFLLTHPLQSAEDANGGA